MRNKCVVLVAAVLSVIGTAHGELFPGENLLQLMPMPQEPWTAYEKSENRVYQRLWVRNKNQDQVQTHVFQGDRHRSIKREHELEITVGNRNCASFDSRGEVEKAENGYPSLTWITSCVTPRGTNIVVLHKAISGNDSFYHLRRIWRGSLTDDDLTAWMKYFATVYACDTRSEDQACPDGFTKLN